MMKIRESEMNRLNVDVISVSEAVTSGSQIFILFLSETEFESETVFSAPKTG